MIEESLIRKVWFLALVVLGAANLILLSLHLSTTSAISIDGSGGANIGSAATAINAAGHGIELVLDSASLGTLIRPADKSRLPVITPIAVAMPAAQAANQTASALPQWPIHGVITTAFGVPEWPYEPIHTGLDISDGQAPGVTPIRPFESGTVVVAVHSTLGLGNHVVVDHGGGITSVYGHLNSIAVEPGQRVGESTIIGYEGETGVATGVHLHFEIRMNGQPVDPHRFIAGHP